MSNWGPFFILSEIMWIERIPSRQFLRMRPTLIFGFGMNLNPLAYFILIRNRGSNIPSRLNSWSKLKSRSCPLVLAKFPDNNIWIWKTVSIDGRLLLHHWRKGTLIALKTLNRCSLGSRDMLTIWRSVELTGWDLNSSFHLFGGQQGRIGMIFH